jgi:threonine/homoserine/homoserine lactone efflux protein
MYNKDTQKDWFGSAVSGAIGGGVLTSWAVVQGQSLGIAILITGISAGVAVLFHKFDIF